MALLALVNDLGVHDLLLGLRAGAVGRGARLAVLADCSCAPWYIASETLWKAPFSASVLERISAASSDVSESRTSLIAASISYLELASTASPSSLS